MAERLDEHRSAAGREQARDLRVRAIEVEVVQDRAADDEVEGAVGEGRRLGVHDGELDLEALGARLLARDLDRDRRDVDPGDVRAAPGQLEGLAPGPQPYSRTRFPAQSS